MLFIFPLTLPSMLKEVYVPLNQVLFLTLKTYAKLYIYVGICISSRNMEHNFCQVLKLICDLKMKNTRAAF